MAQNKADVPLSLHTLPATKSTAVAAAEVLKTQDVSKDTNAKERSISPSTTTIPRLISVVEIVKREYLKTLEITHSRVLSGLHQYNEIGYLEQYDPKETVLSYEERTKALTMALEGKN